MKKLLIVAACAVLCACASLCDPGDTKCQQNAKDADSTFGDAAAIVVGAAVIGAEITAPATPTTSVTTCSTDFWGNKTCTTTTQEH